MKNRDRYILKRNKFDMLTDMNKKILSASNEEYCIMHCLNHKKDIDDKCWFVNSCDKYMEVDCPDKDNMNARFEADGKIINESFPYSFTGFIDACGWFDEQRATYRFARLIASQRG